MIPTVGLDRSALDASFKEHATRGIGRYVLELEKYFQSHTDDSVQVGFFDHTRFREKSWIDTMIDYMPAGRMTMRQQLLYPFRLRAKTPELDILHFPAHMDAPSWRVKKYILTVLDLIPLILADMYKADNPNLRFQFARWLEIQAIKNASLILAISQCTADDVHRMLGIPYERIVVTELGVDQKYFTASLTEDEESLRDRYSIPHNKKIVLYVGGIDQRKNAPGLIQTFRHVVAAYREREQDTPVLVMAGKIQKDKQFPKLQKVIKEANLENDVILPGFVPEEDLLQLYAVSSVFCFMSLYEGFGLPPLEALAAGTPVVSSHTSAMPEVLGDAAMMVDPTEYREAADKVIDVLENPALASALKEAGQARAKLFSWEQTGEKTLAAYRKAVGIDPLPLRGGGNASALIA